MKTRLWLMAIGVLLFLGCDRAPNIDDYKDIISESDVETVIAFDGQIDKHTEVKRSGDDIMLEMAFYGEGIRGALLRVNV
ncbi:hypothetical protein MCHI_003017, partial [Candidatus Magnetoovum chiemensis]